MVAKTSICFVIYVATIICINVVSTNVTFRVSEKFKELNIEIDRNTVGVALLVSNDYTTLGKNRELCSTHKNADNLEQLFEEFGYIVYRKKNVSSGDFMSYQKTLAEFKYPPTCRRLLVYFTGHEEDGSLLMEGGGLVQIENMVAFSDPKIVSNEILEKMAKIFLIDVYRVEKADCYPIESTKPRDKLTCLQRIPKHINTLVAYACTQYTSGVSVGRSWSDCLIKALRESRERDDICCILTRAKQLIGEQPKSQCLRMVADFINNLECEVYFKQEAKHFKSM